jgi:hypothetical protein
VRVVRRTAKNKASEATLTIQPRYFARFSQVEDTPHGGVVRGIAVLSRCLTGRQLMSRRPAHRSFAQTP